MRLVEPVRVEAEPRLERRPRWPMGEVTDDEEVVPVVVGADETAEVVVVVVAALVAEGLESSYRLPKEPLRGGNWRNVIDKAKRAAT